MEERPEWDSEFAGQLLGAIVLVGITYNDPSGARTDEFYGVVESADPTMGIALTLMGERVGDHYHLPPDQRAFQRAPAGSYRLRSTGEVVEDPDFTCSWTIDPPLN